MAKNESLEITSLRDLDLTVNEEAFMDAFVDGFTEILNLRLSSQSANQLIFECLDDEYNAVQVDMTFVESVDSYTDRITTTVTVHVETDYHFKTKFLKLAESESQAVNFKITCERTAILNVKN